MGRATNSYTENPQSRVDKYTKIDNVKNIKDDLSKLKKEVSGSTETQAISKDEEINFGKDKDNKDIIQTRESFTDEMDEDIEEIFDYYVKNDKNRIKDLLKRGESGQKELEKEFDTQIRAKAIKGFEHYKNILDANAIKQFQFELSDLSQEVIDMINNEDKQSSVSGGNGNPFESNKGDGAGTKETYKSNKDYKDPYKQWSYANVDKKDMENIYSDKKLKKTMEDIFDDEDEEELHRGTFGVNLGKESGLAGIIIAIREAVEAGTASTPNETSKAYLLYTELNRRSILNSEDPIAIDFSNKDIRQLVKDGFLKYKHKSGIDNEIRKIVKILNHAKWSDLDAFASLVQSKSDVEMAVKEWHNALEITGNSREDKDRDGEQTSLINETNILEFLCDFNGDGLVDAQGKRKNNKEQMNQGDIGTLFGQQVMFTIEQAIKVQNVELGEPKGEQLVISNIIKNMQIADSRNLDDIQKQPFETMESDLSKCTKENLAKLINGDTDEGILPMPEMKIFFLDSIKIINGGSEAVTPDLYDTLIGKDAESLISLYETQAELTAKLDEILKKSEDKEIQKMIREQGLVRVRETFITSIMTVLDNVEITTNDKNDTRLKAGGVTKGRELNALKRELLQKTIENLITTGIHKGVNGGYIFGIGYGREGTSESGRTKRSRGAGAGFEWDRGPGGAVGFNVNLSGEIAEQYNPNKVINADLSKVASAKYVGFEGGVLGHVGSEDRGVPSAEATGGINRQQDPVVGINQIDKQYRLVSKELFDITGASKAQLADKEAFRAYLQTKIDMGKNNGVYGKFIENNIQHFTDNLNFIVRYMDANKFFGDTGILKQHPNVNTTTIINALVDVLQSGNIEQRRHDVMTGLHGKVAITKLSFGVTTNALTIKANSTTPAPIGESESGETTTTGDNNADTGINEGGANSGLGQDRFGFAGLYVGLRISTWKNSYVPNEAKYLFTQYEVGQGIGAEYINNPTKDLDKYAAYLQALYNDPKNRLSCTADADKRLVITFDPQGSDLTLARFLNLHVDKKLLDTNGKLTKEAEKKLSLKGNVLIIGNVGDIAASTVTEAQGVRRILCLGTKKLDEATRVTDDMGATTVEGITRNETGNKERTEVKIQTDVIDTMKGTGSNLESAKAETAAFFDKAQFKIPAGTTVKLENITEGQKFKNGTLTITKTADKTYTASFNVLPADTFTINYIDQNEYDEALAAAEALPTNRETKEITSTQEIKNTFAMPTNISSTFTESTESTLSIFDDYNQTLYREFMESIVDAPLGDFIDATDYNSAFNKLIIILANEEGAKILPTEFKNLIGRKDLSINEKILIVDKFKTIFSYLTYLTDGNNDGRNISALIGQRGISYKKIPGPNGEIYPLTTDYRKTILNNLKGENTLSRTRVENLIGFTAFYRLNGKGRKYAMTPIGGTNVLTGASLEKSMISIDENDKAKAQEWFIKNLAVNKDNKKMVVAKINLLLNKNGITIAEKDLPTLIRGNELVINSSKKIRIDSNWVFYLLGECGNESFGMELNGISIISLKNDIPIVGKYTGTGIPEKEYKSGAELSGNSHSTTSKVLTNEEKIGWKHHISESTVNEVLANAKPGDTNQKGFIQTTEYQPPDE